MLLYFSKDSETYFLNQLVMLNNGVLHKINTQLCAKC